MAFWTSAVPEHLKQRICNQSAIDTFVSDSALSVPYPSISATKLGAVVKKIEEYRTHAAECLSLSRRTDSDEEKAQLEKMAEVWEALAQYREASKRTE